VSSFALFFNVCLDEYMNYIIVKTEIKKQRSLFKKQKIWLGIFKKKCRNEEKIGEDKRN